MQETFKQRIGIWLLVLATLPGCGMLSQPTCPPPEPPEKPVPPELLESPKPSAESSTASEKLPESLKTLDERINNLRKTISLSPKN